MSFIDDDLQNSFLLDDGCVTVTFRCQSDSEIVTGFFENDPFEDDAVEGFSKVFVIPENQNIKRGWEMVSGTDNYTVRHRRDDGAGLSFVYLK